MNLLDLPLEILQLIIDNLDLKHQLYFTNTCKIARKLDVTNFWDLNGVIKSTAITEKILEQYPRIKSLNLKNNTQVGTIFSPHIRKINIVNSPINVKCLGKLRHLKKIHMDENQNKLNLLNLLNIDATINISFCADVCVKSRIKNAWETDNMKYLWKSIDKIYRINILNAIILNYGASLIMLLYAIKHSCMDSVKLILGENPKLINGSEIIHHGSVLLFACMNCNNSTEIVEFILPFNKYKNICINAINKMCIINCTKIGIKCISLLLNHYKAIFGELDNVGIFLTSAFHNCNNEYSIETIKLLLQNKATVNVLYNETFVIEGLIKFAKTKWAFDCIKLLINKNNVNNFIDDYNNTILNYFCGEYTRVRSAITKCIVEYVFEIGADPNIKDRYSHNALISLISNRRYSHSIIKHKDRSNETRILQMVTNKESVEFQNNNEMTALMLACRSTDYDFETLKYLINTGANLNLQSWEKISALMYAARFGNVDAVKLLICAKADLDLCDKYGRNALMFASISDIIHNNGDIIKLLIDAGANVNTIDIYGNNSLMYAIEHIYKSSSCENVKVLIAAGSNVNIKNKNLLTPLMMLCTSRKIKKPQLFAECFKLLIANGADVNAISNKNSTASISCNC